MGHFSKLQTLKFLDLLLTIMHLHHISKYIIIIANHSITSNCKKKKKKKRMARIFVNALSAMIHVMLRKSITMYRDFALMAAHVFSTINSFRFADLSVERSGSYNMGRSEPIISTFFFVSRSSPFRNYAGIN
ncbi:hypothetical protein ACP275_10G007600 [Erythranthe tilingii]